MLHTKVMIFAYFQITETQYQAYRRTAHLHCHSNLQSHRRPENPLAMLRRIYKGNGKSKIDI